MVVNVKSSGVSAMACCRSDAEDVSSLDTMIISALFGWRMISTQSPAVCSEQENQGKRELIVLVPQE